MEHQLSDVLMQIDGVGNCQVMVRADAGAQYIYVQNQEIDTQDMHTQEKQDVVLLSDSDGEYALTQQVMEPQISGVIVVCEGASSNIVKEHVTNAVQALLGISANRICIVPSAS